MADIHRLREIAISFPEAVEEPHFEKTSFRVKKKIFATCDFKENRACLKFSLAEQDIFSLYDGTLFYPVPNKWGKQGYTYADLERVPEEMLIDALKTAYNNAAPAKLRLSVGMEEEGYRGKDLMG